METDNQNSGILEIAENLIESSDQCTSRATFISENIVNAFGEGATPKMRKIALQKAHRDIMEFRNDVMSMIKVYTLLKQQFKSSV